MEHNSILHGDCIDVLKRFPEKAVDVIFADPPYNMQLKNPLYRPNNTKVAGVDDLWDKFESFADYDRFCAAWLRECGRVLKDTGSLWVMGSYHNIHRIGALMLDLGFWILNDVVWHKTNPMPNFRGKRFTNATETLLWCVKERNRTKYTFNYKTMKRYNGGKQMPSVWRIGVCAGAERLKGEDGKKAHSTQKPEELLKRVILSSTKKGDIVLDPFFGTGTTGAAAKKLKRLFIGIEKDGGYADIARRRIDGIHGFFEEADWDEEGGAKQKPVPFATLVRERVIREGETLYAKKPEGAAAVVRADGAVCYRGAAGSIHQIGRLVQHTASCNGWKFWYITRSDRLIPIDVLRNDYRKEH
ncbi:MAG: site-specific DNA-methyltransferase [Spirochaetaceae bacterium]|nr:site-specific DNA-methyltransferase [Spirochaetaceae bacterium]